ncbi:V-set domain-containing T-cell activation inhibitor 1 [Labeo rohita]|uniref:V-set domain-containing T-cell activation inhibitor 1 n=1 Tax=Labeo rohita TaxID=84645 RepID=A0ABQ8L0V5_LABRO|nr:V-set domain-containing T-cell activation inhibitor 1 [Labeo rohita]
MIWGAVTSAGVGPLCFIKSKVNAAIYQDILEHLLTSFMEMLISFSSKTLPPAHSVKTTSKCCFVCVFAVLINKVCLQVTVEGVIGGSVVLPCFSRKNDLKPQDINVHWRHNYTQIVCDIIQGKDSVEGQNQWYKNRTETFPDEYLKGNFSIKLNNLQHADAGEFSCFITSDSKEETVQLFISGV